MWYDLSLLGLAEYHFGFDFLNGEQICLLFVFDSALITTSTVYVSQEGT
jgi:hypothetical protein